MTPTATQRRAATAAVSTLVLAAALATVPGVLTAVAQPAGANDARNVRALTQPVRIAVPDGFVLNTSPRPDLSRAQGLTFNHAGQRPKWVLTIPFSILTEGAGSGVVTCTVSGQDTDRTVLGVSEQRISFNGHASGQIVLGVRPYAGLEGQAAGSYVCTLRVFGTRQTGPDAGIDWEARDTTPQGSSTPDVWVREDSFTRWWTGPGFEAPFRLRVTGTIR
jgi:hypothetical protein